MIWKWLTSLFEKPEPRLCPVCDTVLVKADGWLCWHQEEYNHMYIDRGTSYILRYVRGPKWVNAFNYQHLLTHYDVQGCGDKCVAFKQKMFDPLPLVKWEIDAPTVPGLDPKKPEWLIAKLDAMDLERQEKA